MTVSEGNILNVPSNIPSGTVRFQQIWPDEAGLQITVKWIIYSIFLTLLDSTR